MLKKQTQNDVLQYFYFSAALHGLESG